MKLKLDRGSILGSLVAVAAITAGLAIDGGRLSQVLQPSAALIVLGGTLGAVLVQFPLQAVLEALHGLGQVFRQPRSERERLVEDLLRYAYKARREGLLSLEVELARIEEPFLRESLMLAIDGVSQAELRRTMELQLDYRAEAEEQAPKVFEAAAGYSPTIGILGAVLGLIQVMQQLQDISTVGRGIAAAFVATIYGVGAANLVFLPIAGKLKIRLRERQIVDEMILESVLGIANGITPRGLEAQLAAYLPDTPSARESDTAALSKAVSR